MSVCWEITRPYFLEGVCQTLNDPVTARFLLTCSLWYSITTGSESVVKYAKENLYIVKTLKEFQYIDEEGKDQGSNGKQRTPSWHLYAKPVVLFVTYGLRLIEYVLLLYLMNIVRQKAKDITALLSDEARLKEERRSRNAMNDRMSGRAHGADRLEPHTPVYERPGATDEDRDLQRALEESRRMAQAENTSRNRYDKCTKGCLMLQTSNHR